MSRLETDRHGVPQFSGDPEMFEEYQERAWDLWHGREGQESLQLATAVHLRAGLSGAAYEATRKIEHSKMKTKDEKGVPTDEGLRHFLAVLKTAIAAVEPVKVNELFLTAFYSSQVWRRPAESMQQYIVRREQDFRRLEEMSKDTHVSTNLRAMMLLIFSGLDHKEQVSVLSSVGNEYNFEKISHALRLQFPQASGKPVVRRDYLGCGRQPQPNRDSGILFKPKAWRQMNSKGRGRGHQSFTADEVLEAGDDDGDYEGDETYHEDIDADEHYEPPTYDGAESFWEDETFDTLVQDMPDLDENPEIADALATVMQYKKKGKGKGKQKGPAGSSSTQSFPFRASGDISFDKNKEARNNAVKFLKSVTTCTSCHQRGHWTGDDACPNKKKNKGASSNSPKKKPHEKKTTFFVLHDSLESDDEKETCLAFAIGDKSTVSKNDLAEQNAKVLKAFATQNTFHVSENADMTLNANAIENASVPQNAFLTEYADLAQYDGLTQYANSSQNDMSRALQPNLNEPNAVTAQMPVPPAGSPPFEAGSNVTKNASAHGVCFTSFDSSVLMVLKDTKLCAHSSYLGGDEREYHRGANGHTRHVSCKNKDCDCTVISGRRKDGEQMWRYLVQIALCTKWGSAARSRELFASVCRERDKALHDREQRAALRPPPGYPGQAASSPGSSPSPKSVDWNLVGEQASSTGADGSSRTAKIVRDREPRFWAYGVLIKPTIDLPDFPLLADEDQDVLQPLPCDMTLCGPETPFEGYSYAQVASSPEASAFCQQILQAALENQPLVPELYRLSFYLFGRCKLLHSAVTRMWKSGEVRPAKRPSNPDEMIAHRCIRVPLCFNIQHPEIVQVHDFEVLMTNDDSRHGDRLDLDSFASTPQDPPGLAILDSGCTRTMHGKDWAEAFELELGKLGLSCRRRPKHQSFRGVGGQIASDTVEVFPVGIHGVNGELHSAEASGALPLLLSRPFMEELQTVIDVGARTVSFKKLGIDGLPLIRTAKGHLAISLLDFDLAAFEDTESPVNAPEQLHTEDHLDFDPAALADHDQPHDFGGMNPDDYFDMMADLDMWRQEAASIQAAIDSGEIVLPQQDEGLMCEDANYLFDHPEQFIVRKATNKKSKKFESWQNNLDGEDWLRQRVLTGKYKKVSNKPPYGKTWMKQLFAGQMGLSLLAIFYGLSIGVPLDVTSSDWDASTSKGYKQVCHDLLYEDPFLTVITQPCGPWGNWSRFNLARGGKSMLTVLELREAGRPILRLVNKVVKDRIKANRHVFVEQPLGSQWLEEEELADVVQLLQNGDLVSIRVDGCQVGYKDRESGLAHFKPSIYITSLLVAESIFNGCRCDGQHAHEPLEGNNKFGSRTLQASEWPEQLNDLVIQAMIQQASAESSAVCGAHEMFPAEVRPAEQPLQGRSPKRRRRAGRVTQLVGQYAAPPVYVRPQLPLQPEVQQPLEDQQLLPDQPQLDDASVRAIQASALDPVLNITEAERRRRWLTISPEIRKILRDLHVQFGHPTNTTLQRILRRQGALPEAIDGADLLSCDSCGDSIRRRRPKPVRLPGRYVFNHHLLIDVFYGKDVVGESFAFLNIIDDATGYQVVSCLGQARGPPASKAVLRHFLTVWSSWAGLPYSAQVDRGKEYLAYFSDHLKTYGVEQETVPLEAPWQNGKVERAGALWKEILYKTVQEMQLQGLDDMILATTIITQCRNSFPRPNGYSPSQWVLGLSEVRVPGSLLDDGEAQRLELLEAADDPTSAFARSLGIRESARVAQVRLDNDARVRRALLHKSTPTRGPYPVGSYVYFYRLQAPPTGQARAQARNFRWFGPARVIGVETRNQRRAEDVEFATEGGQPHAYWLRYGPSVVLVTGEQLRFASEDELLAAHSLPEEVLQPSYTRGARNYVDLRGHAATPQVLDQQQDPAPPGLQFSPTTPFAASRPATIREDTEFPGDVVPATPAPQEERTGDEIQEPEPGPSATPTPQVSRRPSKNVPAAAAATQLSQALQRPDRLDGHPTSSGSQQTTTTPSQLTQQQVQQQNTMVPTSTRTTTTTTIHFYNTTNIIWSLKNLKWTSRISIFRGRRFMGLS